MGWLKNLFRGGEKRHWSDPEIYDTKRDAMAMRLGEPGDDVIAAIIGWDVGGPVDLWVFPNHVPGSVLVTMQLAAPGTTGQRPGSMGLYELAMATREPPGPMFVDGDGPEDPDQDAAGEPVRDRELTSFGRAVSDLRLFLSNLAHYTSAAVLEPGQTAEFPTQEMGPVYLVFDALIGRDAGLRVLGKPYGVLLVLRVHKSELDFARAQGTPALLSRLKEAGAYPYSDLDRDPVA